MKGSAERFLNFTLCALLCLQWQAARAEEPGSVLAPGASSPSAHIGHANGHGHELASVQVPVELSRNFNEKERKQLIKGEVLLSALEKNGHRRVRGRIHIAAPPHVVWETVHEERKTDPDLAYSKVLEVSGQTSTLEQKFQLIPVVGTSVCVMKNVEIPGHRIDYWLLKSDRFKALEGSWIVTPYEDGGTILELSSYIDMGLPVPRNVLEGIAGKKLERRLQNVRKMAERVKGPSVAKKSETSL